MKTRILLTLAALVLAGCSSASSGEIPTSRAQSPGKLIEQFGSVGASHLGGAHLNGTGGLTFLSVAPGGRLGRHPTVLTQLFCVISGEGWVAGDDEQRHAIHAGQAALWSAGEQHSSGSDGGMEVVVLEAGVVEVR